jgi:hypothetical protein
MARIRKALTAAAGAGVAAGWTALQNNGMPHDGEHWAGLVGLVLGAALVAGVATFAVPNKPAQ